MWLAEVLAEKGRFIISYYKRENNNVRSVRSVLFFMATNQRPVQKPVRVSVKLVKAILADLHWAYFIIPQYGGWTKGDDDVTVS